jgi:hypothetical protein
MDTVSAIMAFESGELDAQGTVELFVELFNSGIINHLQGSYGRSGHSLLERGIIYHNGNGKYTINQERLDKLMGNLTSP